MRRRRRRRRLRAAAEMRGKPLRGAWLLARPSREFAPAGDLLSCIDKKVGKETTPAKPPTLRVGPLRCSKPGAAPNSLRSLRSLRSDKGARSQMLMRASRAPRASALLGGLEGEPLEQPNSQEPRPKSLRSWLFLHPPSEPAEQRKDLRACAKRTSLTDSAQLFERSVAKRVLRGPSRPEQRREARSEAKGRADRGRLFAYFLVAQKVGRPPGRTPGAMPRTRRLFTSKPHIAAEATPCL